MQFRSVVLVVITVATILSVERCGWALELRLLRGPWEYHLGQGLRVGNTGLTIGGYGTLRYQDLHDHPQEFSVSDLSLLLSWDSGGRVHLFSELELEDIAVIRKGEGFGSRSNPFEIERLYADVDLFEAMTFRLGKFLTPIGRWNLIHADPLVWTTARPLTTFRAFSQNTTGAMLYGTLTPYGKELNYSLYAEVTDELDADHREEPFKEALGFHLDYHPTDATTVGLSYANFEPRGKHVTHENLVGVDVFWTRRRFELSGEFLYRIGENARRTDEWGVFFQGVVPLPIHFFAIGRYECFSPMGPFPEAHFWTMALAYRPLPPFVVKAEYSVGYRNRANLPEGFATSVAILF